MISRDDALAFVLAGVDRLDTVSVAVTSALGSVLAHDVVAAHLVPPFANSAMDGVALRSVDSAPGARLRLVGTIAAGTVASRSIGPGESMRIMTGAPMPDGADAVVMVERCTFGGAPGEEVVEVADAVPAGHHVRPAGDDIAPGDAVLSAGTTLTPGAIALLRTVGRDRVDVIRRPLVGVFSTGDELVEPPAELGPGQIYDSNRSALVGLLAESGFDPLDLGVIADDEERIEGAVRDGVARCDALVTSGGVSMGDFDFVKTVLDRIGDMRWMQIAIKPAKPLAFGTVHSRGRAVPVFGLPGNPVSSMVSFELFARPALRKMAGHEVLERPTVAAIAEHDFGRRSDGKTHFVRVVVSVDDAGCYRVVSAGGQGSHHVASMAAANGLVVLDDGEGARAGETVWVLLIGPVI